MTTTNVKENQKPPTQKPLTQYPTLKPSAITGTGTELSSDKNVSPLFNNLMNNLNSNNKPQASFDNTEEMDKVLESLDKNQKFNFEMLKAIIKNPSIPDENGGTGDEIDNINKITQMISAGQSMRAQVKSQKMLIEAQQNPAMNLLDLKGMKIEYKDDKRYFNKGSVKYNYMVEGNESKNPYITSTLRILNKQGKEINRYKERSKIGDNNFEWDGTDSYGKIVDPGDYFLEVEAFSVNSDNKSVIQEQLNAGCIYSGIAESVKIGRGGVAEGIIIDGKIVKKDMINSASAAITDEQDYISIKNNLIDRVASIDLSRSWIENGSMTAYYYNDQDSDPLSIKIKIHDRNGTWIKDIEVTRDLVNGYGFVELHDLKLPDGEYRLKIFVKNDDNTPMKELSPNLERRVYSVNENANQFNSNYNENFSGRNIQLIKNDFLTAVEKRRDNYLNSSVPYINDHFDFDKNDTENVSFAFKTSDKEELIFIGGRMQIFDTENDEALVATIDQPYEAEKMLDPESLKIMQEEIDLLKDNDTDASEARIRLNEYIESEIKNGELDLLSVLTKDFEDNLRMVYFPNWDGVKNDGNLATQGTRYRRNFVSLYRNRNSKLESFGNVENEIEYSLVTSVDQELDLLKLNLKNGKTVYEDGKIFFEKNT